MFTDWQLTEVSNFLSDILLATFLFYWSKNLKKLDVPNALDNTWALFFFLIGASAFIGGWGHLLSLHIGTQGLLISWSLSILAVLSLEIGLLKALNIPAKWTYPFYLKAVIFLGFTIFYENFMWVKSDMTLGVVFIIIPILVKHYFNTQNQAYPIIIGGLLANGLGGIIHTLNLSFSPNFDHRDLAHVVSIVCFGIIFFGLKKLSESEESIENEVTESALN
jgi:hypothetical protein